MTVLNGCRSFPPAAAITAGLLFLACSWPHPCWTFLRVGTVSGCGKRKVSQGTQPSQTALTQPYSYKRWESASPDPGSASAFPDQPPGRAGQGSLPHGAAGKAAQAHSVWRAGSVALASFWTKSPAAQQALGASRDLTCFWLHALLPAGGHKADLYAAASLLLPLV